MFELDALTPQIERVAKNLYYRVYSVSIELDDLIQEGLVAAWQAYEKYDPKKAPTDRSFIGYCMARAHGGMINYLRGEFARAAISLDEWLEVDSKDGSYTREIADPQPARVVASLSQRRMVLKMLRALPEKEQAVLRSRYGVEDRKGRCYSVADVKKRYKMKDGAYHDARRRAIRRLQTV